MIPVDDVGRTQCPTGAPEVFSSVIFVFSDLKNLQVRNFKAFITKLAHNSRIWRRRTVVDLPQKMLKIPGTKSFPVKLAKSLYHMSVRYPPTLIPVPGVYKILFNIISYAVKKTRFFSNFRKILVYMRFIIPKPTFLKIKVTYFVGNFLTYLVHFVVFR